MIKSGTWHFTVKPLLSKHYSENQKVFVSTGACLKQEKFEHFGFKWNLQ